MLCARDVRHLKPRALQQENFARATLRKFSTGFLFKLFNAQLLHFVALVVLFLVVGSFFKHVFSNVRLLHAYLFRAYATLFLDLSTKFCGVAKTHA